MCLAGVRHLPTPSVVISDGYSRVRECNIQAVTTVGKIISVLLATAGMMLLPVFTVYLTDIIRNGRITKHVEAE